MVDYTIVPVNLSLRHSLETPTPNSPSYNDTGDVRSRTPGRRRDPDGLTRPRREKDGQPGEESVGSRDEGHSGEGHSVLLHSVGGCR